MKCLSTEDPRKNTTHAGQFYCNPKKGGLTRKTVQRWLWPLNISPTLSHYLSPKLSRKYNERLSGWRNGGIKTVNDGQFNCLAKVWQRKSLQNKP